jgi:hypothetical protein
MVPVAHRPEPQFASAVNIVSDPIDQLTPAQRLGEVAEILAAGMLRLRRKLGQIPVTAEPVRLDFSPERSVHAAPGRRRRDAA